MSVEICNNIVGELKKEFKNAKEIWVAVAMMNNGGFSLFNDLSNKVIQNIVVGIDLPTPPGTLKNLLDKCSSHFSAKIYESKYTYHPKLYIIQNLNGDYCAFVGSSNATYSGLNNNVELNVKITNQEECERLVKWYLDIELKAKLLTKDLINTYAKRYKKIKSRTDKLIEEIKITKEEMEYGDEQFFPPNQHAIFSEKYRKVNSNSLLELRKNVRSRMIELHNRILPQFFDYGLLDLHPNYRKQDRTSRHYINGYSGKSIQSIWLHYGKSKQQLEVYKNKKEKSFANNCRIQVIIHEDTIGVWLILGKDFGSKIDRNYFRLQMENEQVSNYFFESFKALDDKYFINYNGWNNLVKVKNIKIKKQLIEITKKEDLSEYFIIGKDYNFNDKALSKNNLANTVLQEFSMLYPLYLIMRSL